MKQLFAILLVYVFLITNSCNHSKITFGQKYDFKRTEEAASEEFKSDAEETHPEEDQLSLVKESTKIGEEPFIEGRTFEQLDKLLGDEYKEPFHAVVDKIKTKKYLTTRNSKRESENQGDSRNPTVLVVVGLILFVGAIGLTFYALKILKDTGGTADGCLTAILQGALIAILAAILGLTGIILITIGLVVFFRK